MMCDGILETSGEVARASIRWNSHEFRYRDSVVKRIPVTTMLSVVTALCFMSMIHPTASAAEGTIVEHVTDRVTGRVVDPDAPLATKPYEPSARERPFFEKLAPEEVKTGGLAGDYDITKKSGRYVGWFGIVREVEPDATGKQAVLTVEHKYFDGLTDAHMMAVSFNGSGDFQAVVDGPGHGIIPLLALVKIYGTVAPSAPGKRPTVKADFLRVWHWETFTFLAARGEQRGSERWRKLSQVDLDNIYHPSPDRDYYELLLGPPRVSKAARQYLLKVAGPMTPDLEARVNKMIDAVYGIFDNPLAGPTSRMPDVHGEEAAIAVLAECLQDPDKSIRFVAADGLGCVGPKAIPWLISALQSSEAGVRVSAAFALQHHRSAAKDAVPALAAALADADPLVRRMSALAIGATGRAGQPAVLQLKRLLGDADPIVQLNAATAIWLVTEACQPSVATLIELLTHEDQHIRYLAADRLDDFGPKANKAVPALLTALSDDDLYVRARAASVLGSIGPEAKAAVPALLMALGDDSDYVRSQSAEALGRIRADAATVVPALIAALSDEDAFVRSRAADALAEFGPAAADAIPVLVKILRHEPDELTRGVCGRKLVEIDPTGKTFLPVLIENLRDPSAKVRRFAAWALGDLGPAAAGAVEPLAKALEDSEAVVRVYAAGALWKIDENTTPAVVDALVAALRGDDSLIRGWAAQEVRGTGPVAICAVPALIENLTSDPNDGFAADALGRIGPQAAAAVEPVTKLLRDKGGEIRVGVADALWRIRRDDASLQPLIETLGSDHPWTPQSAAIALGNIGPNAKAAVPALTELLEHPEGYVRQSVADALEKIDPAPTDGKTEKPADDDDVGHLGFPGGPLSAKEPPPRKP